MTENRGVGEYLPRRHDKWMVPTMLVVVPSLLTALISWVAWAASTSKDINAIDTQNKTQEIRLCTVEGNNKLVKEALIKNTETLKSIERNIEKLEQAHTDSIRKLDASQQKTMDLIIDLLKKDIKNKQ